MSLTPRAKSWTWKSLRSKKMSCWLEVETTTVTSCTTGTPFPCRHSVRSTFRNLG